MSLECRWGNCLELSYHSPALLYLTSSLVLLRRQGRLREVVLLAMPMDRGNDQDRDWKSDPPSCSPPPSVECSFPNRVWFFRPLTPCFIPFVPDSPTPHHGLLTLACTCRGMPSSSPQWEELWSTSTITARPLTMILPCYSSVSPGLRPWNSSFSQYAFLLLARKCAVERSAGWPAGGEGTKQVCVSVNAMPSPPDHSNSCWCSALGFMERVFVYDLIEPSKNSERWNGGEYYNSCFMMLSPCTQKKQDPLLKGRSLSKAGLDR